MILPPILFFFFFFNDTATTEIYTLPLHDALPIYASLENEPGFLFDVLVLPDGERGVRELAKDGHTLEFIKDQYRHCKPIMVMPASPVFMHMPKIPPLLPSGNEDP